MHKLCHFMSVFMVTWIQNRLSESQKRKHLVDMESHIIILFFIASTFSLTKLKIKVKHGKPLYIGQTTCNKLLIFNCVIYSFEPSCN